MSLFLFTTIEVNNRSCEIPLLRCLIGTVYVKVAVSAKGAKIVRVKIPGDSPALQMSHESIIIIEQILLQYRRPQSTR